MVSIWEIVGQVFAGLGLFFIGVYFIKVNLRNITGRGFRMFLAKITKYGWLSSIIGIFSGGVTQSTTAVTFIMTGMISAGLVTVRRVMPMVLWSNAGNCILVFLAVINFHVMILYLLGLVGFLYYCDVDRSKFLKPLIGVFLGVSLLFLGLDFMKSGAHPLKDFEWVENFIQYAGRVYILGLLAAGLLSFIAQSAATVTAIAIALTSSGILGLEHTIMIVYGTNLGPGISTWLMSSKLSGPSKQLAIFQVLFKLLTLTIMVVLFYIEVYLHIPLVIALLQKISGKITHQLALAYLLFQVFGSVLLTLFMGPLATYLKKKFPETEEEQLSKTKYIYDQALEDPFAALDLLEKEQSRVLKRLATYLDEVRDDGGQRSDLETLHTATVSLDKQMEEYLHSLLNKDLSRSMIDRGLNFQNRMELYINLEETLYEMIKPIRGQTFSEGLKKFLQSIFEASHLLLITAEDAIQDSDKEDRHLLLIMTEDRGDMMRKIHEEIREMYPNLAFQEHRIFELVSSRFERLVWMIRYLTKLVEDLNIKK